MPGTVRIWSGLLLRLVRKAMIRSTPTDLTLHQSLVRPRGLQRIDLTPDLDGSLESMGLLDVHLAPSFSMEHIPKLDKLNRATRCKIHLKTTPFLLTMTIQLRLVVRSKRVLVIEWMMIRVHLPNIIVEMF